VITRRLGAAAVGAFALLLLLSCDIPEAPEWEIDLVLPLVTDTFTWDDILPPVITTDTVDGRAVFVINLPTEVVEYQLGEVCSFCVDNNGNTVTIPPFDFSDSLDIRFPPELYSAEVSAAEFIVEIENQVNFDLFPQPDPSDTKPTLILVLRDLATAETVDSVVIGGGSESLPPGSNWSRSLTITDQTLTGGVRLVFWFHYPGSETPIEIDLSGLVRLFGTLDGTVIPGIVVVLDDERWEEDDRLAIDDETFDDILYRYRSGLIEVVLFHSLEATGVIELSFAATRDHLFSGDPQNEVNLGELELTSGLLQEVGLSREQLETISAFPDTFFAGYRGVVDGTRVGPGGETKLSVILADQFAHVRLKLHGRLAVGG
jgi:hypothetical protein